MILYFYDYDIVNMNYEWRQSCQQCSGWMYDLNHESLQYTPEKDYPVHLFPDNIINNKLKPTMITKSNIEKQINDLIKYLKENQITMSEAKVFLRYVGINNNAQQYVLNNYNIITKYELPSAWYQSDKISLFVDVPMHLLMLGVVKSVMLKVGACLREIKQNTKFIQLTHGILGHIKK